MLGDAWRLRHPLGSGAMGVVWRAWDQALERDVAIKLVTREDWQSDEMREVFREEARALAKVTHPNVVSVYSLGELLLPSHAVAPYYVMQYLPGGTLREWTDRAGGPPLAIDIALDVLSDVAAGVDAIHDAGLVHFDLKPGNVLHDSTGRWVVTDLTFGTWAERQRVRGMFVGTPAYGAPERITGVAGVGGARSVDVYALGVMAFELLTGRRPFHARSVAELMSMHVVAPPPTPSELSPDLPAVFDAPLLAALSKNPQERPLTAAHFVRLLRDAAERVPSAGALRIGVADDDADIRALIVAMLREGLQPKEVCEYEDGGALLAAHAHRRFDLVVVDLQMPGLGADAVTRALRAAESAVGIVVVSGVGSAADWHRLSQMGADAFLLKPLSADALLAVARRAAPAGQQRAGADPARPDTLPDLVGRPVRERLDTQPDPPKPRSG